MRRANGFTRWWSTILLVGAVAATSACAPKVTVPQWDPAAYRDLDTLEFLTVGPTEGPHWSTVWLVVLDDQVYVRLGSRAADRMKQNTTNPIVGLRIGGREYERVHAIDAAPMADRVAAAMGGKYWTDIFVRYAAHPLTMRFEPEAAAAAGR